MEETNRLLQDLIQSIKDLTMTKGYEASGKNPYELLTKKQITEEYGIPEYSLNKIFNDKTLPINKFTRTFTIQRQKLDEYLSKKHKI